MEVVADKIWKVYVDRESTEIPQSLCVRKYKALA